MLVMVVVEILVVVDVPGEVKFSVNVKGEVLGAGCEGVLVVGAEVVVGL